MKQYVAFVIALVCAFCLTGCVNTSENNTETIDLKEVSGLVLLKGCTEEELNEKLVGESYENILRSWGNPTKTTSDSQSGTWILDETSGMLLTLTYDTHGIVKDVLLGYEEEPDETWDRIPMVMVNGTLYLDTGLESTVEYRCGVMDGTITSTVDGSETPTVDGQSNFGAGYGFQYGPAEGTIEIYMNEKWWVFATEEVRQEIQFPTEEPDPLPDSVADFETVVTISAEDAEEIANIICTGTAADKTPACICVRWENGTSDCIPDCAITLDDTLYYYHSDCGTVTDETNNRSLHLDEDCKTALNTLLGQYLRLGTVPVSPTQ